MRLLVYVEWTGMRGSPPAYPPLTLLQLYRCTWGCVISSGLFYGLSTPAHDAIQPHGGVTVLLAMADGNRLLPAESHSLAAHRLLTPRQCQALQDVLFIDSDADPTGETGCVRVRA